MSLTLGDSGSWEPRSRGMPLRFPGNSLAIGFGWSLSVDATPSVLKVECVMSILSRLQVRGCGGGLRSFDIPTRLHKPHSKTRPRWSLHAARRVGVDGGTMQRCSDVRLPGSKILPVVFLSSVSVQELSFNRPQVFACFKFKSSLFPQYTTRLKPFLTGVFDNHKLR